ncbi:MAG: hypothetical protein QXS85_04100 [Acidilobaceae archaeon]
MHSCHDLGIDTDIRVKVCKMIEEVLREIDGYIDECFGKRNPLEAMEVRKRREFRVAAAHLVRASWYLGCLPEQIKSSSMLAEIVWEEFLEERLERIRRGIVE